MLNQLTLYHIVIILIFPLLNLYTFALFYIDKQRAIKKLPRISEKTLLLSSFAFGGIGAWLGMKRFRHKTQKVKFKMGVPIGAIVSLLILFSLLLLNF